MASISKSANGTRTIQFIGKDGKRRSLRLGKVSERHAESIKYRVETLNASLISGVPLDNDTASWLRDTGDDLHGKLSAVGLVTPRASARLGEFLDGYIKGRTDAKKSSQVFLAVNGRRILKFFDADRLVRDITEGDADAFAIWLKSNYALGTAGRTIKAIRQFFHAAARQKLITANPFMHVKPAAEVNKSRQRFIDRDTIQKVIDSAPDAEWRLLIALSRYGGLRCPSEHLALTWGDVLLTEGKFRVNSPKTGERWVPIFPELRPYFEDCRELASGEDLRVLPDETPVITHYRDTNANLRTQLNRIIRRAGLKPWPKLFHNLRASRETELANDYPLHVAVAWIGNTAAIANAHYLQVTDEHFTKAASAANSGAVDVQNAVQTELTGSDYKVAEEPEPEGEANVRTLVTNPIAYITDLLMSRVGLEPTTL